MGLAFKLNSHVVYPGHGVAVIRAVEEKKIGQNSEKYYILELIENKMRILLPIKNAKKVGLRNIISDSEVKKISKILRGAPEEGDPNWNRRHTEYLEKLKTGSIEKAAEVYRDLMYAKNEKELSFGEKKILDTTKKLLLTEISFAKNITEEKAEDMLNNIFADK